MIEVTNLSKSFGAINAVQNLNFKANDGQITTFLGGNGAGKTTTLRMIMGIETIDHGSVLINQKNIEDDLIAARKETGFMPDRFGLYPFLTTREHLIYFAELSDLKGANLNHAVEETIERLELHDIAERRTNGFSQGQRMKVALGNTIVASPQNIILDEPTRGLDIFAVRLLRNLLQSLRDKGSCILLSSHDMAEVEALSDQIVVIADGQIKAKGSPEKIKELGQSRFLEEAFITLVSKEISNG